MEKNIHQTLEMRAFDCSDSVEIFETTWNTSVAKLCGNEVPEPISVKGNLKIVYTTSPEAPSTSSSYGQFLIKYKASGEYIVLLMGISEVRPHS